MEGVFESSLKGILFKNNGVDILKGEYTSGFLIFNT